MAPLWQGNPEGVLTLKRGTGMSSGKDPLFTLPQRLHKTPFSAFFSSTRPHFKQKSQNFPIFCSKCLNLVNFQFLSLKIGQNPVQEASFGPKISSDNSIFVKISVQQAPKFGADPFYKPPFSALRAAHPFQNESWVLPPPGGQGNPFLVERWQLSLVALQRIWS